MLSNSELNLIKKWQSMNDIQKAVYMRRKSKKFAFERIKKAFTKSRGHIMQIPEKTLEDLRNDFRSRKWVTEKTRIKRRQSTLAFKDMKFKRILSIAEQSNIIDTFNNMDELSRAKLIRNSGERYASLVLMSKAVGKALEATRPLRELIDTERNLLKAIKKHVST